MAAISTYPTTSAADPIVRGDPLTISVPITVAGVAQDITTWTWRAQVRRKFADGELLFAFATSVESGGDGNVLLLDATASQTALLRSGDVFDLEQLTPVVRTWWIVTAMRVAKDVSHA